MGSKSVGISPEAPVATNFNNVNLKTRISMLDATGVLVGVTIGSGIFISPYVVLQAVGSPLMAIIVWIVAGLVVYLAALTYSEMSTMMPDAGGSYTFLRKGWGEVVGFCYMMVLSIFFTPGSTAAVSMTFSRYLGQLLFSGLCLDNIELVERLLASVALGLLFFINSYNMNWVMKLGNIVSSTKLLSLAVIVVSGFASFGLPTREESLQNISMDNMLSNISTDPADYVDGVIGAFWAFTGFQSCVNLAEELKPPLSRTIPGFMTLGFFIITLTYVLTNLAYLIVLSPSEMLSSTAVALTFGSKISPVFFYLIPLFVALSTFGTMNALVASNVRSYLSASREGHLPRQLSIVTVKSQIPIVSLVAYACLTMVYIWADNLTALFFRLIYSMTVFDILTISVLVKIKLLRHFGTIKRIMKGEDGHNDTSHQENKRNGFSLPLVVPVCLLAFYSMLLVLPLVKTPVESIKKLLFALVGLPLYLVFIYPNPDRLPKMFRDFDRSLMASCEKLFMGLPCSRKLE